MVIMCQGSADASRDFGVYMYDNGAAFGAKLDITYVTGNAARSVYYHMVGGMR